MSGIVACIPSVFRLTSCASNGSASITTDTYRISLDNTKPERAIGSRQTKHQLSTKPLIPSHLHSLCEALVKGCVYVKINVEIGYKSNPPSRKAAQPTDQ